jgi:hypothetical protein
MLLQYLAVHRCSSCDRHCLYGLCVRYSIDPGLTVVYCETAAVEHVQCTAMHLPMLNRCTVAHCQCLQYSAKADMKGRQEGGVLPAFLACMCLSSTRSHSSNECHSGRVCMPCSAGCCAGYLHASHSYGHARVTARCCCLQDWYMASYCCICCCWLQVLQQGVPGG